MPSMALHRLLLLIPVQTWLLITPAVQAHNDSGTMFLPDDHRGPVCTAFAPQCMTKRQWASYCRKTYTQANPSAMPQSCWDALNSDSHPMPEPPTQFLPDNHNGRACRALMPACMTRGQWAEVCKGYKQQDPNYVFPKSCRDALDLP